MAVHQRPQHMEFLASLYSPSIFLSVHSGICSPCSRSPSLVYLLQKSTTPRYEDKLTAKGRYPLPVCNILRFALWQLYNSSGMPCGKNPSGGTLIIGLPPAVYVSNCILPTPRFPVIFLYPSLVDILRSYPPLPASGICSLRYNSWALASGISGDTGQPPLPGHPHAGIRYYPVIQR